MFRSAFRKFARSGVATRTFSSSSARNVFLGAVKGRSNTANLFIGTSIIFAAMTLASPAHNATPDYVKMKADIIAAIAADDERRGDGTSIGPTLVRLAWHASGTFSIFDKTGGSNGATMRFGPESNWGANAGKYMK